MKIRKFGDKKLRNHSVKMQQVVMFGTNQKENRTLIDNLNYE